MSAPVYGSPPELTGRVIEEARVQSFVDRGVLVPGAQVVFLKTADGWFRVSIDHGTVHWRRQAEEPKTWSVPEEGWVYPVADLPGAEEVLGVPISSVVTSGANAAAAVEVSFENGRKLLIAGAGDENAVSAV